MPNNKKIQTKSNNIDRKRKRYLDYQKSKKPKSYADNKYLVKK